MRLQRVKIGKKFYEFKLTWVYRSLTIIGIICLVVSRFIDFPFGSKTFLELELSVNDLIEKIYFSDQSPSNNDLDYFETGNYPPKEISINNFAKNNIFLNTLNIDPIFLQRELCIDVKFSDGSVLAGTYLVTSVNENGREIFNINPSGKVNPENHCFILNQNEERDKIISFPIVINNLKFFDELQKHENEQIYVKLRSRFVYGLSTTIFIYTASFVSIITLIFLIEKTMEFIKR